MELFLTLQTFFSSIFHKSRVSLWIIKKIHTRRAKNSSLRKTPKKINFLTERTETRPNAATDCNELTQTNINQHAAKQKRRNVKWGDRLLHVESALSTVSPRLFPLLSVVNQLRQNNNKARKYMLLNAVQCWLMLRDVSRCMSADSFCDRAIREQNKRRSRFFYETHSRWDHKR